ncbi:hypothetical protein FQU76_13455 [Streptomyces qinzhouensis]|uniref:Amino acid ABC transporter permease n=1 Tax=Streptomyces qinzhouensis TaxID=2599401 RepID=A0A5B8IGN9_9ACTN|nr:hypothetical protein FQU76_13455 [Streptomyces qinzhouensis]
MPEFDAQRWREMFGAAPSDSAGPAAGDVSMSLASNAPLDPAVPGPSGGSGGMGRLLHGSTPWRQAAKAAGDLRTGADQSHRMLGSGHQGIDQWGAGLGSVPALKDVLVSWEERLASVRGECAYLSGALLRVADDLPGVDVGVGSSMGASTPGAGGER